MVAGADDDAVVGPLQHVRLSLRHFGPVFPEKVRRELRDSSYGNLWPISRIATLRTAVMRFRGGHDEVFGGWAGHASPRIRYQRGIGTNRQDRHHAAVLG